MVTRRILLYSHDTYGLGHLTRTLRIAEGLVAAGNTCLVVTGTACPELLRAFPGQDFVKLPSVTKTGPDVYPARTLGVPSRDIVALRSSIIRSSVAAFQPQVVVVDNVPRGMLGELDETLAAIRSGALTARLVLTMRDILDAPSVIRPAWRLNGIYDLLKDVYDEILVFGSRNLFDVRREYAFPAEVRKRTTFCGYIGSKFVSPSEPPIKLLLTVGGGGDGAPLARHFIEACRLLPEEIRTPSLMVLGPDMAARDRHKIEALAEEIPGLSVAGFVPDLMSVAANASAVVSMGGYNTLAELASLGRRVLVAPRCYPRVEQLMRAQLFKSLGLVDVLLAEDLEPQRMAERIRQVLFAPAVGAPTGDVSFDGLSIGVERIVRQADSLRADRPRRVSSG